MLPQLNQLMLDLIIWIGVVVGLLNSECSQQDRADENEHGAHSEYIHSQGKVHG